MNKTDFKAKLANKESFIVKFSAWWCGPCKALAARLEELDIPVDTFDVALEVEGLDVAAECKVRNVPTLVSFKDGKEVARLSGLPSAVMLEEFLTKETV